MPRLEEVDRRRAQLWGLSLLVSVAVPAVMIAVGMDGWPAIIERAFDLRTVRLGLLAMLVAVMGYVAEREVTLRRLTGLLVREQVLTASLVNRVDELNLLLRATRAMNSALDLRSVVDQIAESAHRLLDAGDVVVHLIDRDQLRVAATHGSAGPAIGERHRLEQGLAGRAAMTRDALMSSDRHEVAGPNGASGEEIAVPMEVRGGLIGVVTVTAGPARDAFTEFDLRSMSVFANAAGAAIANARAYEEQLGRVASLLKADQAKDEFLTLVTHEMRTPLTSMIGLLSTMASRSTTLTAQQVSEFAGIAQTQGWRLDRLIGDLLDASKAQRRALEIAPEITAVEPVLTNVVEAVRRAEPGRIVTLAVPDGLVRCLDAEALLRVADNLVSNAAKFSPPGSPIEVVVRDEARGVRIDVVDHGPGIDPAERAALFEKFTRGPDPQERGGLGLGLYVVQALAEAHAGRVEVSQTPGGGATVSVWLAAWPPATPEAVRAGA